MKTNDEYRDMLIAEALANPTQCIATLLEDVNKLQVQVVVLTDHLISALAAVDPTGTGTTAILRDRMRSIEREASP